MKFGIIGNTDKVGLADAVEALVQKLDASNVSYILDRDVFSLLEGKSKKSAAGRCTTVEECVEGADILVAFGGDGTILNAVRAVGSRSTPILGVNLGKLGFLAELAPDEIEAAIGDILKKQYVIEERLVLEASFPSDSGKQTYALNDIVIGKSSYTTLIDLETHIDGSFAVTYRADGLVLSTPTGSTAYALSNGGPIVVPTSRVIGITPIAPHTLSGRPLIVPDESSIRVIAHANSDDVSFFADGQLAGSYRSPVEIRLKSASFKARLIKRVDRSYFDVLRAKLMWGKDPRGV